MQLNVARLCLDCEEVHSSQSCPTCASETFAYLTRWVPRIETRTLAHSSAKPLVVPTRVQRIVFGGGAISLAAYIFMRWLQRARKRIEIHSLRAAGELR
jgi:hypothetical protein